MAARENQRSDLPPGGPPGRWWLLVGPSPKGFLSSLRTRTREDSIPPRSRLGQAPVGSARVDDESPIAAPKLPGGPVYRDSVGADMRVEMLRRATRAER